MSPVAVSPELERWRGHVEGHKFVWLHCPPWDGVWTRQNHFARRLAALGGEVLYVESPGGWESALRREGLSALRPKASTIREVERGVYVLSASRAFPGSMISDAIARRNARKMASFTQSWLEERGWSEWLAWCRVPKSVYYLDYLNPRSVVYDVTDDYPLYVDGFKRDRVQDREHSLLQRADVVFVASRRLQQRTDLAQSGAVFLSNGVDYELFARATDPSTPIADEFHDQAAPLIGYVGLTAEWMDFDLIRQLGARWPGQIVMVGPVRPDLKSMAHEIDGVRWIDFVPQSRVPSYLKAFKVCIIPHVLSERIKRSNSLKIWEYLAAGVPVVSVDLPALEPVRENVYIAKSHDEFVSCIESALEDNAGLAGRIARQHVAAGHSWNHLTARAIEHIAHLL